jgi:lysophospholipase L1-like esterase
VAKVVAIGGGAVVGAAATAAGVLTAQGLNARREAGVRRTVPPYADGRYGGNRGVSLRLAVLGDSLAAGLGADYPYQTLGAILADNLSRQAKRPVVLSTIAAVGSRSDHLAAQVERALIVRPHIAVIIIGANDVTHFRPLRRQTKLLRQAIVQLREAGAQVVLGTCPDLSASSLFRPPARTVAHRQSRRLAGLQTKAALQAGAVTVSLADLLAPEFSMRPELFAADHFHPSPAGYEALAEVMTPAVLSAAGLGLAGLPEKYHPPRTERLLTAIDEAVATPGTVLAPVTDAASGERRRLTVLLQRRRAPRPAPAAEAGSSS